MSYSVSGREGSRGRGCLARGGRRRGGGWRRGSEGSRGPGAGRGSSTGRRGPAWPAPAGRTSGEELSMIVIVLSASPCVLHSVHVTTVGGEQSPPPPRGLSLTFTAPPRTGAGTSTGHLSSVSARFRSDERARLDML